MTKKFRIWGLVQDRLSPVFALHRCGSRQITEANRCTSWQARWNLWTYPLLPVYSEVNPKGHLFALDNRPSIYR